MKHVKLGSLEFIQYPLAALNDEAQFKTNSALECVAQWSTKV